MKGFLFYLEDLIMFLHYQINLFSNLFRQIQTTEVTRTHHQENTMSFV